MADISKITLPTGTTYDIKDAWARQRINDLGSATVYRGVTTTALTDGATTNPITIGGESYTAVSGDIVQYKPSSSSAREFIFNGTSWDEFGSTGSLKALAFKDSATGSTTYTPAGSVTQPTFSGNELTSTGSFTPAGSISSSTSGTTNYTPAGSVSSSFEGSEVSATYSKATGATITLTANTATATGRITYLQDISLSAPTISLDDAGSTTTIKNPTSKNVVNSISVAAGAAADATNEVKYTEVSGETLIFKKIVPSIAASITTSNVTVKNGDATYTSSAPGVTKTIRYLSASASISNSDTTIKFTPAGTVTSTFTGTAVRLAFAGTAGTVSVKGTPSGTVTKPTFSGTQATISITAS